MSWREDLSRAPDTRAFCQYWRHLTAARGVRWIRRLTLSLSPSFSRNDDRGFTAKGRTFEQLPKRSCARKNAAGIFRYAKEVRSSLRFPFCQLTILNERPKSSNAWLQTGVYSVEFEKVVADGICKY